MGLQPAGSWSSRREAADEEFQKGADRPPTAKTLYAMALLQAAQGDGAQCEATLLHILRTHPDFLPAYDELARLQARHRRIEQAIRTLRAGLAVSPESPVLINNLGMCLMLRSDCEAALDCFQRAAGQTPQDARYRANMAMALGMLGRYEEALSLYEQVVSPGRAHYNLAVLCEARNDDARAVLEFAQARALGEFQPPEAHAAERNPPDRPPLRDD
jgi:Flp pilus assembly protein TadD